MVLNSDYYKNIPYNTTHLEYANPVWSPHLWKLSKMIENVQVRATKLVDGMKNIKYANRLKKLDLPTLQHRRERGDMIEVWKLPCPKHLE